MATSNKMNMTSGRQSRWNTLSRGTMGMSMISALEVSRTVESNWRPLRPGETQSCIAIFRLPFVDDSTVFPTTVQVRFNDETRDPMSPPRKQSIVLTGRMTDRNTLLQIDGKMTESGEYQWPIDYTYISPNNAKQRKPVVGKLAERCYTRQYLEFLIAFEPLFRNEKLPFEELIAQVRAELQKLDPPLRAYVTERLQPKLTSRARAQGFKAKTQLILKPE